MGKPTEKDRLDDQGIKGRVLSYLNVASNVDKLCAVVSTVMNSGLRIKKGISEQDEETRNFPRTVAYCRESIL
jgi:hypothetical protein